MDVGEVPSLECKVSLLKCYEVVENYLDWEVEPSPLRVLLLPCSDCLPMVYPPTCTPTLL